MNGILLSFASVAIAAGVALPSAAYAADVTPTVLTSATPADGSTVEKLSTVMTQWEYAETDFDIDISRDKQAVSLTDGEGTVVTYGSLRNTPSGIQINLDEEVTAPGEYTLTIKPDMIWVIGDIDEETWDYIPMEGSYNAETELHYTIAPAVAPTVLVSANPEDGSTVEKLSTIMTVWDHAETEIDMDVNPSKAAVTVTDATGTVVTNGSLRNTMSGIQINLDEEVTAPGEYTVTIAADMIWVIADIDWDTFEYIPMEGSYNAETALHYTIAPAVAPTVLVSANPEDGSTVEKLSSIMTEWDHAETEIDMDVNPSKTAVTVTDATGTVVTNGSLRNTMSGIQINLDEEVTAPGEYTVTIAADMIWVIADIDWDTFEYIPMEGSYNAETKLHYTVSDSTGVDAVASEGVKLVVADGTIAVAGAPQAEVSVWNAAGQCVANAALQPGIYIVSVSLDGKNFTAKVAVK